MSLLSNIKKAHGEQGEQLAAQWLLDNGFEILHANWRSGRYEIDLVARSLCDMELHIVEVKTRKAGSLTSPEEAYTKAKFRALCAAANAYVALYDMDVDVHFDLVAVELNEGALPEIRFIADAMTPSW
ncbi:MAG: YraN family protein [Rikenellaceae bacterium]